MPNQVVPCVVCHQSMKKVTIAENVEVDCCDNHGVWLDRNELQRIVAFSVEQKQRETQAAAPSVLDGVGRTLVQGAASGAGWSFGSEMASSLISRLFR